MAENEYECSTCGSRTLVLKSDDGRTWIITCGQGHPLIPVPGEEYFCMG